MNVKEDPTRYGYSTFLLEPKHKRGLSEQLFTCILYFLVGALTFVFSVYNFHKVNQNKSFFFNTNQNKSLNWSSLLTKHKTLSTTRKYKAFIV